MRQITYIFTFLIFNSCGQISTSSKSTINSEARKLNDSAVVLHMTLSKKNTKKAIDILDKATKIDPEYYLAHWNKYIFLNELNRKEQAFETLKILESIRPENPELLMASGVFHENNNDCSIANEKFRKANDIYESILDTLENDGIQYSMLQSNRAMNQILLRKEITGREILKNLYLNEDNESFKEMIQYFLTLSRQDILDGKMNKK